MTTFKIDTLGQCVPSPTFPASIFPIGMAVLDIMLRLAGFIAVIWVIIAGVEYVLAQGNSEQAAGARRTLYNALIGVGIAFSAALIVEFAGRSLT